MKGKLKTRQCYQGAVKGKEMPRAAGRMMASLIFFIIFYSLDSIFLNINYKDKLDEIF